MAGKEKFRAADVNIRFLAVIPTSPKCVSSYRNAILWESCL